MYERLNFTFSYFSIITKSELRNLANTLNYSFLFLQNQTSYQQSFAILNNHYLPIFALKLHNIYQIMLVLHRAHG